MQLAPVSAELSRLQDTVPPVSWPDIAATLDITEAAAMKRHSRALRRFGRICPD